jgi:hypothetical protein
VLEGWVGEQGNGEISDKLWDGRKVGLARGGYGFLAKEHDFYYAADRTTLGGKDCLGPWLSAPQLP